MGKEQLTETVTFATEDDLLNHIKTISTYKSILGGWFKQGSIKWYINSEYAEWDGTYSITRFL